ncbi:MAG: MBOAT family protein [Clostridiales bacterium]|nr:MBOAT family protein [Clostridiales bacterium]
MKRKLYVALSFASNLFILYLFKYFNFSISTLNQILKYAHLSVIKPSFSLLLPVGISFYTFQALSYTMDVYRGKIDAERNFLKYSLFVSFFPQLVAGPIERTKNLLTQIGEEHHFDYNRMINGFILMLWGYFQKVVIADRVAILVDTVFDNYQKYSGFQILIAIFFFSIQIYCDFAGYSNIAIGAAQIMGFKLTVNFNRPYLALSIQDFWRRWHITLSTWFRDYLYISLGGNRCSRIKKYRNIMITFLVSGLWHGANWNYVIWGGLHGLYQIVEDALKTIRTKARHIEKLPNDGSLFKFVQIIVTFILVCFAWIFFRASSLDTAFGVIKRIVMNFGVEEIFKLSSYRFGLGLKDLIVAGLATFLCMLTDIVSEKLDLFKWFHARNPFIKWATLYCWTLVIIFLGKFGPSSFLYFQF